MATGLLECGFLYGGRLVDDVLRLHLYSFTQHQKGWLSIIQIHNGCIMLEGNARFLITWNSSLDLFPCCVKYG